MNLLQAEGSVDVRVWAPIGEIEASALEQIKKVAKLPWAFHHVAIMPDAHFGIGCTVGSVIAMKNAVSPAAVGVDVGCGMMATLTNLTASDLPDNLHAVRSAVERAIPVGFNWHKDTVDPGGELGERIAELYGQFDGLDPKVQGMKLGKGGVPTTTTTKAQAFQQLGTLGGGNHFIELCIDTQDRVWLMLHSGSRGIGNQLATLHIAKARTLAHNAELPDPDLAVFLAGTPEMAAYRRDLFWAQRYAMLNRKVMMQLYLEALEPFFPTIHTLTGIACHHNYVAEETHFGEEVLVTRKGAIRAGVGEMGIIPGSMGTRSFIVEGLGNPDSFSSASHGAGRRMSRGQAKRQFTIADLAEQTAGVECRKDEGVLDEIPGAYKDIDQVMANQKDLVKITAELHAVLCVKG